MSRHLAAARYLHDQARALAGCAYGTAAPSLATSGQTVTVLVDEDDVPKDAQPETLVVKAVAIEPRPRPAKRKRKKAKR